MKGGQTLGKKRHLYVSSSIKNRVTIQQLYGFPGRHRGSDSKRLSIPGNKSTQQYHASICRLHGIGQQSMEPMSLTCLSGQSRLSQIRA